MRSSHVSILLVSSFPPFAFQSIAAVPQVVRFEWQPSPVETNINAYFYWDIRNVKECYSTTSGSSQPALKATSGTAGPATNSFPYTGVSKWYCITLDGNRYPSDPNTYIEAKRIVEAPLATPQVSLGSGSYSTPISVSAISASGVTYRYTLDGSQVTQNSAQFTSPLTIQTATTLKVRGFRPGFNPSPELTVNYMFNIIPVVRKFEWNPSPAEVGMPAYFSWNIEYVKECFTTTADSGRTERRAASGTAGPATNTFPYTGTSRWYCTDLQGNRYPADPNRFIEAKRIVEAPISPAKLLPQGGEYVDFVDLSLNRQSFVNYRYTTDGSPVTTGSALFPATSLRVSKNTVVKVRGYRDGFNPTPEVTAAYKILRNFSVTASAGSGGSIDPSSVRVVEGKTTSFTVTPAVGYRLDKIEGCGASSTISPFVTPPITANCQVSATFTPVQSVDLPTFSPNGGPHNGAVQVCLSSTTLGAEIRYSIDGSDVSKTSLLYAGCFPLESTATVKAKAFKSGMTDSVQSSAAFVIEPAKEVEYIYDDNGRLLRTETKK